MKNINVILDISYGDTDVPSSMACTGSLFSFCFMFSDSQMALHINSIRLILTTIGGFWIRRWITAVTGYNSYLDFLICKCFFLLRERFCLGDDSRLLQTCKFCDSLILCIAKAGPCVYLFITIAYLFQDLKLCFILICLTCEE